MAGDDIQQPETSADDIPQPAPEAEETLKLEVAPLAEHPADEPATATPSADTITDAEPTVDESSADTTVTDEPLADEIAAQETAELASVAEDDSSLSPVVEETTLHLPVVEETTLHLPVVDEAPLDLPLVDEATEVDLPVVEQATEIHLPVAEETTLQLPTANVDEAAVPSPVAVSAPEAASTLLPATAVEPLALPMPLESLAPVPTIDEPAPRLLLPTVVEPLPPLAPSRPEPRRGLRLVAIIAMLLLLPVVIAGTLLQLQSSQRTGTAPTAQPTVARTTGPFQWQSDTLKTAPDPQFAVFATQKNPVDPAFQQYYARHNGATLLGNALTPGYTTDGGWIQIFANGALLKPITTPAKPKATPTPGNLSAQIISEGSADPATGVVRIPLLHSLLTVGSALPIGGTNSSLSYVDLRQATAATHQTSIPVWRAEHGDSTANAVFIAERQQNGQAFGHDIPLSIWAYINRPDVAPEGWEAAFGQPITEALAATVVSNGTTHHLLVQAFWLGAVEVDTDDLDANGQPTAQVVATGADYLRTLGPPTVAITEGAQAWATGNLAVVSAPGSNSASVHLGVNFPVTLTGQTRWLNGALWYSVSWKSVSRNGTGWAPGSAITRTTPSADAPAYASFDALSPDIARYLAGFGNNAGSVIYDITRGQYYTYNADTQFTLASSSKVSIMMAYLDMVESQGRSLTSQESYEISIMIQHSDNNAAQLLYDRLGDGAGMTAWMQKVGVHGYLAHPSGWGWGMLPPTGQMQLLTMLQKGQILNAKDRAYALGLMRTIESDQRNGVGDTLPAGASVAMKDGWVPEPDGLWAVNTSGIVTAGSETYIIVVYTEHQLSENAGWTIARYVCSHAGKLLAS